MLPVFESTRSVFLALLLIVKVIVFSAEAHGSSGALAPRALRATL
jgi:hypothetical protein